MKRGGTMDSSSSDNRTIIVCDHPSNFKVPDNGYASQERWFYTVAKYALKLGFDVVLSGPLWRTAYIPGAKHFEDRITKDTKNKFLSLYGRADYLVASNEYFGRSEWEEPFLEVANVALAFEHGGGIYNGIVFDRKRKHLFCYSDEMMEKYRDQSPHKLPGFYIEPIDAEPCLGENLGYLICVGRLDRDKLPHIAILAAQKLGIPIYLIGSPLRQPDYFKEYEHIFSLPVVRKLGTVTDAEKMRYIASAACGLYAKTPDYPEAFGVVLSEYLLSGVPVAGITWTGNDSVVEHVGKRGGKVVPVNSSMTDDDIANRLAYAVEYCLKMDRKNVYHWAKMRYQPQVMVKTMFKLANEEPCGKPQGIKIHMPTATSATLWQATGYFRDQGGC